MKILFRFFAFILFFIGVHNDCLFAQDYISTKKENRMYECAKKKIREQKPAKAIELLQKLLKKYPKNPMAYEELAFIYAGKKDWNKAKEFMLQSIELNNHSSAKQLLFIANYCHKMEDIQCEEQYLHEHLNHPKTKKNKVKIQERLQAIYTKKEIVKNSPNIVLEQLPSTINKEGENQYLSQLTIDGKQMIFTRRVNRQEDFFRSFYVNDSWSEAEPIQSLNTPYNEGAHTISGDGNIILFTKCNAGGPHKSCDIYISSKNGKKYSAPQPVHMINTSSWEAQPSISADGNTIYFSSSRDGGHGLRDIYYIERINKKWSEVKNLGKVINTSGDEETPFIHPDGRTLYFTSSGHPGMGGKDLFVTKKQLDGSWSTPLNLGSNINTSADEGGLSIDTKGKYAYFSKTEIENNQAKTNIYRFELPKLFKPNPVSYMDITVIDQETNQPIDATLEITENDKTRVLDISKKGLLEIFEADKEYQLQIEKKGYLFYSSKIQPTQSDKLSPVELHISLIPLNKDIVYDTPVVLQNVTFATNSSELTKKSEKELLTLLQLLEDNPNSRIRINGHTDNVGSNSDNLRLSNMRANSVKDFLIKKGILGNRIETKGFGSTKPIASNDTESGKALNRRTEFQMIK